MVLKEGEIDALFHDCAAFPGYKLVVDLDKQTVSTTDGSKAFVVWGRSDPLYQSPLAPRLAREVSAGRLEVMETGHAPHMEQPAHFVSSISSFLMGTKG